MQILPSNISCLKVELQAKLHDAWLMGAQYRSIRRAIVHRRVDSSIAGMVEGIKALQPELE